MPSIDNLFPTPEHAYTPIPLHKVQHLFFLPTFFAGAFPMTPGPSLANSEDTTNIPGSSSFQIPELHNHFCPISQPNRKRSMFRL